MNNPTQTPYKGLGNLEYGLGVKDGLRLDIPDAYPPTVASIMKAIFLESIYSGTNYNFLNKQI